MQCNGNLETLATVSWDDALASANLIYRTLLDELANEMDVDLADAIELLPQHARCKALEQSGACRVRARALQQQFESRAVEDCGSPHRYVEELPSLLDEALKNFGVGTATFSEAAAVQAASIEESSSHDAMILPASSTVLATKDDTGVQTATANAPNKGAAPTLARNSKREYEISVKIFDSLLERSCGSGEAMAKVPAVFSSFSHSP